MPDVNKHILTLSVIIGEGCNNDCKFCISKLTFKAEPKCRFWREKLHKACEVAKRGNSDTVIITSKGEPTLSPDLLYTIETCAKYFPIVELQTNGIVIDHTLADNMARKGLTTVAISCVSYRHEDNKEMLGKNSPELEKVVSVCKEWGLLTRACIIMTNRICGTMDLLLDQITGLKRIGFDQVTLRIMGTPDLSLVQTTPKAKKVIDWIAENSIPKDSISIKNWVENYPLIRKFPWGSEIRLIEGIPVCLTDCLSEEQGNDLRYVIYFPDGHLRTRWDVAGTMLF